MNNNILTIGDPHFRTDNFQEVELFISKVEEIIISRKPSLVVVLGDLLHYHERVIISCLNIAYKFIKMIAKYCPLYLLVGNHDMESHLQFLTEDHWMNAMKYWTNVTIVDKVIFDIQRNIVLLPYVSPGRFIEALNTLNTSIWNTCRFIFCHQEFRNCKMGAILSEIGDEWPEDYPQIISGHIHDRQTIGKNIYYTGSSIQHAFGEDSNKSILLLNMDSGYREEIFLKLPRKRILNMTIKEIEEYNPVSDSKDKIRINIVDCGPEEYKEFRKVTKFKELVTKGVKIVAPMRNMVISKEYSRDGILSFSFEKMVLELIKDETNPYVKSTYDLIFSSS